MVGVAGGRDATDAFRRRAKRENENMEKKKFSSPPNAPGRERVGMIISVALRLRALADLGVTSTLIGEAMNGGIFSLLLSSSMSRVVRARLRLGVRSGVWSCSDLVDGAGDDDSW